MSHDLLLGFTSKPQGLPAFLLDQEYSLHEGERFEDGIEASTYRRLDETRSDLGVWLTYRDEVSDDDRGLWRKGYPSADCVAAAFVSTRGSQSAFDEREHYRIANEIERRYGALFLVRLEAHGGVASMTTVPPSQPNVHNGREH